jgi:8-oxo-dGTP pyrophosphatase MutT (NUDIX family)
MKILVNKVHVEITRDHHDLDHIEYESVFDAKKDKDIESVFSFDSALIIRPGDKDVQSIINRFLEDHKEDKLRKVTFVVFKPKLFKDSFKKKYHYQRLAGGLVQKGNKFLLIHENNKWGLPKGRVGKDEEKAAAAKREVEEETGVAVNLHKKLGSTFRLSSKDGGTFRQYHWYLMDTEDRSRLKPSMLEGIKDARWLTRSEIGRLHEDLDWYVEEVLKRYDRYLLKRMRLKA